MNTARHVVSLRLTSWSDEALVAGLRRRDRAAASALFNRSKAMVNGLVWRVMGADSEHDDLVQHVFLAAFRTAHHLADASKLDSWMRGVALNTLRFELRRRKWRKLFRFMLPEDDEQPGTTLDPASAADAHRLYATLDDVSPDARLAFVLHVLEGLTLPELATSLGVSVATAKRRVREARDHLLRHAAPGDPVTALVQEVDDVA